MATRQKEAKREGLAASLFLAGTAQRGNAMTAIDEKRERKSHIWAREENEHYVEPAWISARLFEECSFVGSVYDPCCGFGTIVDSAKRAGLEAQGSDLVDRANGRFQVLNFLKAPECFEADNIVCNVPFNIADKITLRALKAARWKVAIVFPVARLNAAHWLKDLPLVCVWLLSPRPSMPPGYVVARGEKAAGGKMDYCWLEFERGHYAGTGLRWLYRDRERA